MNRKQNKPARQSNRNRISMIEGLEARQLMSGTPAVVAYLPDYEINAGLMGLLQSSRFEGLTQVNYFSVLPDTKGTLPGTTVGTGKKAHSNTSTISSSGSDISSQLPQLVAAAHADGVKVDVVLGGSGSNSDTLNTVIRGGSTLWNNLASSIQSFANTYGVDGVDLDWEPSAATASDISNYGQLIDTIKHSTSGLSLSAAVNAEPLWLAPSYGSTSYVLNATAIADLDTINVMDYDLGNPGDGAPIQQAETDMRNWVTNAGAPASKLIMGLPFYGRATTMTADQMPASNPWQNATDSNTSTAGYGAIVSALHGNLPTTLDITSNIDVSVSVPNTFKGDDSYAIWNFDGPGTINAKTNFALSSGFGGVMIWSLGMDSYTVTATDTNGAPTAEQFNDYSLLPVVKNAVQSFNGNSPVNNTPAQLTGMAIGSAAAAGSSLNNAFDGDLNSFFDAAGAGTNSSPDWVGIDLGSAKTLSQIKFSARPGYEWRMEGGVFQASNTADFSNGTTDLFTVGNTAAPSSTSLTSINVSGSYRYVRFLAPIGAYGNIGEMQVFGTSAAQTNNLAIASIFSTTNIDQNQN